MVQARSWETIFQSPSAALQSSEPKMAFLGKRGTENVTGPQLSHKISKFLMKSISLPARWNIALGTICREVPADRKGPLEDLKEDLDACKKGRREEHNVI